MSNVHFTGEKDLEFRSGGDVDHTTLVTLFKLLGYNVHVLYDQTAQEMQEKLQNFAQLPAHRVTDSCIVALLSHGVEGGIYGVDGKLLQLQEVFRLFDNANCPSLQNKPKMFFIQACRGDETDRGVDQQDGKSHAQSPGCEESDAGKEELMKMRLPTRSDMICGYACLKGNAAMRNTKRGSWYIEALTQVFSERACDMHVADMLVKVNALIKEREGYAPGTEFHRCKEMSEYCSTLCQQLYLFPGYPPTWRHLLVMLLEATEPRGTMETSLQDVFVLSTPSGIWDSPKLVSCQPSPSLGVKLEDSSSGVVFSSCRASYEWICCQKHFGYSQWD